ncbi:hypothetical protein [Marinicella sp. W31]|uniref:hypothetical protein n=1 Tax=Marinicella sp. W31 TaxID=3023713 RepID=UPI003757AF16
MKDLECKYYVIKKPWIVYILLFLLFPTSLLAGAPSRLLLEPSVPSVNDTITLGVDPVLTPCLIFLQNNDGITELVEVNGNDISITVVALSFTPCPGTGSGVFERFEIGLLPQGEYTLNAFWAGPTVSLPVANENLRISLGEPINFIVSGGSIPRAVPSLGFFSIILLSVLIIIFLRTKKLLCKIGRRL